MLLDAGDGAVANAVYVNGYIYAVFEVIPPGSTQPAAHWVQINASNNSLVAQGNITGPGGAVAFNPSIAVDANGDVLVDFTSSSSSMYPGAFAAVTCRLFVVPGAGPVRLHQCAGDRDLRGHQQRYQVGRLFDRRC